MNDATTTQILLGLYLALKDCADYLDRIPESAAGGDDEARRLVRCAQQALRMARRE